MTFARRLGYAAAALALALCGTACGPETPDPAAQAGPPQSDSASPGAFGVTEQIHGIDVIDAHIPQPAAHAARAVVELTLDDTDYHHADALVSATSPAAAHVVMTRTPQGTSVSAIPVPAATAGPVHLGPGGYALVLAGLRHPLTAGQKVSLTLVFARAGRVTLSLPVTPAVPGGQ